MPQIYFDFANLNLFTAPGTPADNWQIFGLNGNDSLTGGSLADTIYGGDDNDSLFGLGGDDVLNGGTGDDFFDGGSGNDYAFGDIGNDTFFGGSGNDFFDGGAGTDVANYSSFASRITLRPTGTILKGSGGTDQLFQVETIIANAGVSNNTIDASTAASPASINVNLFTNNLQVVGGPVLTFTVTNFDNVIGTNQNDSITGDNQANQLSGNAGSDTINGGIGNDTLNGGIGNDILNGGSNDDFLSGVNSASVSPGTNEIDTLTGASGVDRFILGDSSKAYYLTSSPAPFGVNDYARITDFQAGVDKLQLRSGNYLFSSFNPSTSTIPGNFFVYRDNATVGSLTSADDLVAAMTVIGTFNSAIDVIFVQPIPIPITAIPITRIPIAWLCLLGITVLPDSQKFV